MMSKAVFLDLGSTSHNDLDLTPLTQACASIRYVQTTQPNECLAHIADAEIIISNKVILDASLLEALKSQVKLVCIAATGTNNVDLACAKRLNIPVTNIRGYASQSVAEHVIGLIFALRRQLVTYYVALQRGDWHKSPHFCLLDYPMSTVAGSTLAIVGYGVLGQAVAQLAHQIGMNVVIAEQPNAPVRAGRMEFEAALQCADVVSLHCPLTPTTRHLINAARLKLMKPNALLINTARGGIVDEAALLTALQQNLIAGAGIDVLEQEPPCNDAVLLNAALPNLLITPHVAWANQTARQTLINQLAHIIQTWCTDGTIINQVT